MSVCGIFVRTNGTAPASYRIWTKTASFSAYLPIQETHPAGIRQQIEHLLGGRYVPIVVSSPFIDNWSLSEMGRP